MGLHLAVQAYVSRGPEAAAARLLGTALSTIEVCLVALTVYKNTRGPVPIRVL
jgi:hypothetical protein